MIDQMAWEIRPFEGAGPVELGMTRDEVSSVIGSKPRSFKKVKWDEQLTDAYDDVLVHAYFDGAGKLEYLEFGNPSILILWGKRLFVEPPAAVQAALEGAGYDVRADALGFDCFGLGLTVYVPETLVDGVGVCSKEYAAELFSMRVDKA